MRLLAWVQVNLINAQIPRGKPKLTVEKLMPRKRDDDADEARAERAQDDDEQVPHVSPGLSPQEQVRALNARMRRIHARKDARDFWSGPEGRKMLSVLED